MSIRSTLVDRLFLPKSFDETTSSKPYDFIMPNGYGRNTYSNRETVTVVHRKRDELGDDIGMFEWLASEGFDPGKPNRSLAMMCDTECARTIPIIIGQWEVMYALWLENPIRYRRQIASFITIWPLKKNYLATRGFLLEAKRVADVRGLKTPLVIAHPKHIQRCFFLAEKIFGQARTTRCAFEERWYDPESIQWQTRGERFWLFYELCLARPYDLLHGWL
ncbi:MAG: hypothetical protein HGA31_05240 [Candidatus Moranbacteria bacterium]|nr:hypothetical protein [Candidatus Moranbacteria bacterium]